MTIRAYLDMDGVLVDFVRGMMAAHGCYRPLSEVRWGLHEVLGVPEEKLWSVCGHDFWAGLGWTEEGPPLLRSVETLFGVGNVTLLTSVGPQPGGPEGKASWVRKHLPDYVDRLIVADGGRHQFTGVLSVGGKHELAAPDAILIDDHEGYVDRFIEHGGHAVLVPRPWNRRKTDTDGAGRFSVARVINELRDRVEALRCPPPPTRPRTGSSVPSAVGTAACVRR